MGPLFRAGYTLEAVLDHTLPQLQWMGFALHVAEIRWWERVLGPAEKEGASPQRSSPPRPGPSSSSRRGAVDQFRPERPPGMSSREWEVEKEMQRARYLQRAGIGVTITRGGQVVSDG